jgi:U3 small nucleolar RNA-associated protein 14
LEILDPEEAAKRLLKEEKTFLKERVLLKHKNNSKWIKHAMQYQGKVEGLDEKISEQILKGDEIRNKMKKRVDEDEDEEGIVEDLMTETDKTISEVFFFEIKKVKRK